MTILINRPMRLRLLAGCKFIISKAGFSTNNRIFQAKLHDLKILDRTLDKPHRSFYRSLDRERVLYKKNHVVIEPSIRHLLVQLQKESEGKIHEMRSSDQIIPNPFKIQNLLEPIVFHIILSLHLIIDSSHLNAKYIHNQLQNQKKQLTTILRKLTTSKTTIYSYGDIKSGIEHDLGIQLDEISSRFVLQFTNPGDLIRTENDFSEILEMSLLCFLIISKKAYKQQYSIDDDLISWILSIMTSGVSRSCESLKNLANIPPFILCDILRRTPMSKNEFYLQADIWLDFMPSIGIAYHNRIKHLKSCINNMIFYGIQYDSHKLPELLFRTLEFFSSTTTGFKFQLITQDFLNGIIWKLVFDYLRSSIPYKPNIMTNIIKTQEIVVHHLSKVGDNNEKVNSKLNMEGNMGVVLSINNVSQEKAEKLFRIAEKKIVNDLHHSTGKHISLYHFTKVFLSSTPEELLHNFNHAASDYSRSATLWLGFIKKLDEFGLLNEKRSKKILTELVNNRDKILITKDIILILLRPIQKLDDIDEFIAILHKGKTPNSTSDSQLAEAHSSSIFPKYLTILYKNAHLKGKVNTKFPGDRYRKIHPLIAKASNDKAEYLKGLPSAFSYARHFYDTGFRKKTSKIVGIMLNGEANIQPENIYNLYKQELFDKNNIAPDESCLTALIKAALKQLDPKDKSTCFVWGDLYAPQIAIHEFKQHVMSEAFSSDNGGTDSDPRIYPHDDLWQKYIHLLAKYEYIYELSIIIQWWEQLNFKPNYATLLKLLGSLPIEYGSRYIKHAEKVKADGAKSTNAHIGDDTKRNIPNTQDWLWPTMDELHNFKNQKLKTSSSDYP